MSELPNSNDLLSELALRLTFDQALGAVPEEYKDLVRLLAPQLRKLSRDELSNFIGNVGKGASEKAIPALEQHMTGVELAAQKKLLAELTVRYARRTYTQRKKREQFFKTALLIALQVALRSV